MKSKISINLEVSLIEIIISTLILATAGAIILNCFAMARFTQIKSNDKVIAGIKTQNVLELIKSTKNYDEIDKTLFNYYSEKNSDKDSLTLTEYFDKDCEKCSGDNKEYLMTVKIVSSNTISGNLNNIEITVEKVRPYPFIKNNNESIYSVISKKFYPIKGGNDNG